MNTINSACVKDNEPAVPATTTPTGGEESGGCNDSQHDRATEDCTSSPNKSPPTPSENYAGSSDSSGGTWRKKVQTSSTVSEWLGRQWRRYDRLVDNYVAQDNGAIQKALCLAFVRSVLGDECTEQLLADMVFEMTKEMTLECTEAIGVENVSTTKSQLLFILWSLPFCTWRRQLFEAFRDYFSRDITYPLVSFRHAVGTTLTSIAAKITDPLVNVVERFI